MKKLLSFAKTKKQPSGNSETGSVLSVGYDLKDKDLGKVHKAAAAGDLEKLRQLAKKKDINQLDKDNRTALHIACASGHVEVVLFLLEGKAKLNLCDNQNRSALMKAVQCQHERCVRLLLENHADPNLVDIKGNTALHLAANIPSVSTAVLLLEHEADINAPNKEASTPLAVAVREDHLEMAEFLLKEGADVSSPDHDKRSPLMAAAGNGQIAMLRLLLRFDADTSLKDNKGWSADDYAVMNGHHPCSLLIFEHNTQKTKDQPSSHQDPSQNKKNALSGNSSQHAGAGFHFSGPAIDRQDFEDNDSESLSRYSKSVPDEWASSEDDESLFGNKKPQKINLREMMALKRGEASAQPDKFLSGTDSEPESRVQRPPSLPVDLPSSKAPRRPVDPAPVSSLSKAPLMTSCPPSSYRKEGSGDEDDDSEEDEDLSDESDGSEGSGAEEEKRVFRSGLGLEKEGRALNSSQSESSSESPEKMQEEKTRLDFQDQEKASVKEVNKENSLFIPTFSRGNRMGALEARWSVDRMRANLGEAGNSADDETGGKPVDKDELTQKEPPEKVRKGPLTLLSRLEGDKDQQMDVMEELGLGHIGDLDDLSDWDSTASNRSLPGGDPAFPGQDAAECSGSAKKPEEDKVPAPPLTPQRSIGSTRGSETSSPPQPVPHPRARKRSPQTAESGDESDLEPDRLASPSNTVRIKAVREGSTDPSPADEESEQQQLKRSDETVDTQEIDEGNPDPSAPAGSGGGEPDNDRRDQCGPEGGGGVADGIPWERRYEKLWVEVEKREVKSNYRNVAGELKERFGELPESRCPSEDSTQEQQDESTSEEEDSSDEEEEGEVIVRPTNRARSTFLLTIPEQRESGLEDSLSESSDKSSSEDKFQDHGGPAYKTSACPEPDGAKPGPLRKPHLDLNWKETAAAPDEAVTGHASSDEDLEERSCPPSLRRRAASVPGVSDEELEEDMERFKVEVGVLRGVFLDLEKEKAQLQKEVGRHDPKSAVEGQRSSNSWDTGGAAPQEFGAEESNARLKVLLSPDGGIQQEHPPAATESADRPPLHPPPPLQQTCDHHKQEGQAEQETLQPEPVRGARHSRALQTISHLNGDPLLVSDDSSVSDVSDVGGRPSTGGLRKHKNPEEIEMAENLDELSLSSDTLSDDAPASGYHHASQLIQKLGLSSLDSKSTLKLQSIFHEYERSIEKARSRHGYLKYKVSQLEMEKAELTSSLEEANDVTFGLERDRLELQSDIANLKFRLKQDQENCRNTTMLFDITKDRLRKTEEQQQLEVQEKQKVELTLRNLEMEMRTLVTNMKQLEDEHIETQRLLAQERSVRTLQENVLNNHLRKQQEIEEENQKSSHEVMSQLTAASGREREFLQQTAVLQEQLSILKSDLDCSRANSSLTHGQLSEENGILKGQLDAARRELSLGSDALTKTIFDCNNKVTAIRSELAMTGASLENERKTHEILQAEVESTRIRLAEAVKETELCQRAQRDTERSLLREKEEHQRLKDRLSGEAASQREVISSLSQKLAKAEANANNMENDVHRVTLQLTEKDLLLDVLQREKDQSAARVKDLETTLQAEKELVIRAGARQEAAQERLAQAQSEGLLLRQQLEETQNKDVAKAHAVTDAQERFSDMLSKLRSDCSERVHLVEDKNKELVSKVADLRDQNYKLEDERNQREGGLRQLQQELADSLKKLSMSEAHLEVNARYRSDLEEEKARLLKDLDRLKGKLQESEDQYVGAEKRIISLKNTLDDREKELATAVQKVQAAEVAAAATDATIKHLEETMHRLEIENARQEVAAKQQTSRLDSLQKGAEEASMLRGHLEELVTNLQSSKMTLENQLSHEVQKQSALTHTVQDSHNMWEEELKSHSKLGLRLAELEKEKGEASAQMEVEKKKVRKVVEQKNSLETRLDQEMTRNTELQKEMYRLRSLLKTAKRKLRDQDRGGAEHDSPLRRRDLDGHSGPEGAFGRLTERVDDLRTQLEKEASLRGRLERANEDLKDQLGSMRSFNNSNDELHRSKRLLEQEVLDLRRRMETSQVEQNQMEHYLQQRTRQEVQQKLDQVNLFLQSEAASRETMDRIKTTGAANLRVQLEQKILKLEGELGHAHSARLELERYKQLYTDELRLRQALATKLDRLNAQLAEANTKLLKSSGRSLIPGGLLLDPGSSGSPTHYRATAGNLSGSQGLGVSFLSSVTDRQRGGVEDYLSKVQSELDRSISKELKNAAAELDMTSTRLSPVGSASWVELDPVHRASQQYLEVLKKNYEI